MSEEKDADALEGPEEADREGARSDRPKTRDITDVETSLHGTGGQALASALTKPKLKSGATSKPHIVPTSGAFIPFASGKTELNAGILHLYREKQEVQDILQLQSIPVGNDESGTLSPDALKDVKGSGTVLCVLAVPSYMTAQDFLQFIGPARKSIAHVRIVRDSLPNRYMVLIKFRDPKSADKFYKQFNGREFNSLEPEVCHVVYIKSVEFNSKAIPPYAFPPLPDESDQSAVLLSTRTATSPVASSKIATTPGVDEASQATTSSSGPVSAATPSASGASSSTSSDGPSPNTSRIPVTSQLLELPTCPVCLERMDVSVTGLLTIVCHHTFHCHCLAKWGDSSCPVCRYSQKSQPEEEENLNQCFDCGATQDLWICLICGNIGCGRYRAAHAQAHFADTTHLYAMELETQRVWDYAGDGYVHRLIQNKADGKIVELPAPTTGAAPEPAERYTNGTVSSEKMEEIGLEYSYLLTSQLESQRLWYESQLHQLQTTSATQLSSLQLELDRLRADHERVVSERQQLKAEVPQLLKEKKLAEKRVDKLTERLNALEKAFQDEKELNAGLGANQASWRAQIEAKDAVIKAKEGEVEELKEQVRDLMFYLEAQQKVEASPMKEELQGASVVGVAPPVATSGSRRKGKGKK
ncbi:hypothetical protein HK104_004091 [Borealophlyctis nickersoniae]|nr:hypothetical protein HK104_004091 [Borealophlyctis nickersoniae]